MATLQLEKLIKKHQVKLADDRIAILLWCENGQPYFLCNQDPSKNPPRRTYTNPLDNPNHLYLYMN